MVEFRTDVQILKVSTELGLIFGWAMICKVRDEHDNLVPYNDTDDEQFDEQGMLEAVTEFAMTKRVACDMHARDEDGQPVQDGGVIHHFPLTEEIAKALGIITPVTGLLTALRPDNPETLEKARTGEYTGFSIGGEVIEAEDA